MMKMNHKIATFLLAGVATSLLAGCASGNEGLKEVDIESLVHEVEFPLDESLELTFHYHARNLYVFNEEWPVYQALTDITNISLINTANSVATDSVAQIQLEIIDGLGSDIYGGNNTAPYFMEYGPDGAFYPVNEFLDVMPYFSAYLDENPEVVASITAEDGNIYHIPYIQEGDVARAYFIRTDWLETLGLETPDTVEELEEVLIAFRDEDPNGNGLNDEIPYFNDKWNEMIRLVNLWDARCYAQDDYSQRVVPTEDGTVYHAWMAEEFKEAIKEVSDWYSEGLIDQAIFTKGTSSRPEYLAGDIGGMTHEWTASTSSYNDIVNVEGFQFEAIAPPLTEGGNRWEEHQRMTVRPDGWAVSWACETPSEAFAYMDYFWSEEGRILSNFGIEGEHYTLVDGEPQFTEEILYGEEAVNIYLEKYVGAQLKQGYWMDYNYELQWTNEIGQECVSLYTENDYGAECIQLPTLAYTAEEQIVYEAVLTTVNDFLDETIQRWVMGDSSLVDAEWDAYIAELEALEVDSLIEVYQSAYTRYLETVAAASAE
ncbi:MAG: hypothetical protein R3Y58_10790 [Eubacteriales bacterium]